MIKETVLKNFPTWTPEKQLSEYQGYKTLGEYSPFNESDYALMEMIMNNPNIEATIACDNGVCSLINETIDALTTNTLTILENEVVNCMNNLEIAVNNLRTYEQSHKLSEN